MPFLILVVEFCLYDKLQDRIWMKSPADLDKWWYASEASRMFLESFGLERDYGYHLSDIQENT